MAIARALGRNPGLLQGGITLQATGPLASGAGSLAFDGATGFVVAVHPEPNLQPPFTFEVWCNAAAYQGAALGFQSWPSLISPGPFWGHLVYMVSSNLLAIGVNGSSPGAVLGMPLSLNTWHHFVGTYAGVGGALSVYLDGQFGGPFTSAGSPQQYLGHWHIGANYTLYWYAQTGPWFKGSLAHVAVYPTVLSATRIAAHFAAASATQPGVYESTVLADHPLHYWPLTTVEGQWTPDLVLRRAV